jgi:predicted nucleic acid-binding protein
VPLSGILIDSGPLVALLNKRDQFHDVCLAEAKSLRGNFCTSWAVITEAAHLLKREADAVQKLLGWIRSSELRLLLLSHEDADGLAHVLHRYADQNFDFADATLMHLAEREDIQTVFTIDRRHFAVFRTKLRKHLNIVPTA